MSSTSRKVQDYSRFFNQIAANRKGSVLRQTFADSLANPDLINMGGGLPNPGFFPLKEGSFTLEDGRKIDINPDLMKVSLQYGASHGYQPLMEQLEALTKRLHDPPCWSSSQMIVTSGSQCGLAFAVDMIVDQGDYVILEEPCYAGMTSLVQPYNPRYIGVEADSEGMKPEKLRSALSRWRPQDVRQATRGVPKFIYTNPNGCNPSGGVCSAERRREIYQIASEYNLIILEDDPYYFIQFQDIKDFPPSYLSLDTDGRVMRFDSFSKTVSAGLRVGYIVGPQPLVRKILLQQQTSISHACTLSQVIISEYLRILGEDGYIEHCKKIQQYYKGQRDAILNAAKKHLKGLCEWLVPAGGMFIWMKILGIEDSCSLTKEFVKQGVLIIPGYGFAVGEDMQSPYVRISFSMATPENMDKAFRKMAEVIKARVN